MKYHLITLGCPKNAVDSEGMGGILVAQGHESVATPADADVVIVNTCSFIAAARDETLAVLKELSEGKHAGQRLIAAGCMAESHDSLIKAHVPGVDSTLSTREWMRIGEVVGGNPARPGLAIPLMASNMLPMASVSSPVVLPPPVISLTPASSETETLGSYGDWRTAPITRHASGPSAYLKISDGCNLRCAFCTIPSFKGDMRSKALGAILGEARELVESGVQEIILVAQHLTDYGRDLGLKEDGLPTLLNELCQVVPQDRWIRLMYAYPQSITPRLVEVMASHPQIVHYLDMPLQHAHPATLRRMRRPPDTAKTSALIAMLRDAMPDIAIRSTFIVGFPGETREEFQGLLEFLETTKLDRAGFFRYSLEPGTPAGALPDQVVERVKERRWHEVMELQQRLSIERNRAWRGRTMRVLVEGSGSDETGRPVLACRSYRDAPEVDGMVFVTGDARPGSFIEVTIERSTEYDLWGSIKGAGHPTPTLP